MDRRLLFVYQISITLHFFLITDFFLAPATSVHNLGDYPLTNGSNLWTDDDIFDVRLPRDARHWVIRTSYRRKRALTWADPKTVFELMDQLDSDALEETEKQYTRL